MNIELHIEELVLHGFTPGDRQAIGHTFETELTRILLERGLPPLLAAGAELGTLTGGPFNTAPGDRPQAVGSRIAQSVYEGIGQ